MERGATADAHRRDLVAAVAEIAVAFADAVALFPTAVVGVLVNTDLAAVAPAAPLGCRLTRRERADCDDGGREDNERDLQQRQVRSHGADPSKDSGCGTVEPAA